MKKLILGFGVFISLFIQTQNIAAEEALEALSMNVVLDVSEEGLVQVTEELLINFNQAQQGIIVELPLVYEDVLINGKKKDFVFPVRDYEVLSDDIYEVSQNSQGILIRLGEAGHYLEGEKSYKYRYSIELAQFLESDEFDLFYYNILSKNWHFPIRELNFEINFPKDLQEAAIFHVSDDLDLTYQQEARKISGQVKNLRAHQAVTLEQYLAQDYFNYKNHDHRFKFLVFLVFPFSVLTGLVYFLYSRSYPLVKTVEFMAPDNLSSTDVAYIYRGKVSDGDLTSLILFWASLGYLKIEELENKTLRLHLEKPMGSERKFAERQVFSGLFKQGDMVELKDLEYRFYPVIQHAKSTWKDSFDPDIYDSRSKFFQKIFFFLFPFVFSLFLAAQTYYEFPLLSYSLPPLILYFVFLLLIMLIFRKFLVLDLGRKAYRLKFVLSFFAFSLSILVLHFLFMGPEVSFYIYSLSFLAIFSFLLIANMGRRSVEGQKLYGQVLGFRRFIEIAEKDRLELLLEENPDYYYDSLAFAHVLGLSNLWAKKFAGLALEPPSWYLSPGMNFNPYLTWRMMNRNLNQMQRSMTKMPAPKVRTGGGGNFGSGGGFGSGGSAGGGFGGSGGRGW